MTSEVIYNKYGYVSGRKHYCKHCDWGYNNWYQTHNFGMCTTPNFIQEMPEYQEGLKAKERMGMSGMELLHLYQVNRDKASHEAAISKTETTTKD
jgi:hypothetical protein